MQFKQRKPMQKAIRIQEKVCKLIPMKEFVNGIE